MLTRDAINLILMGNSYIEGIGNVYNFDMIFDFKGEEIHFILKHIVKDYYNVPLDYIHHSYTCLPTKMATGQFIHVGLLQCGILVYVHGEKIYDARHLKDVLLRHAVGK